ncbi:DUF4255 domain-containing protein [Mastigocoleus testarum]|uniref:Pvc16 N-terminal domain-containing protein n=1 Tax=Mastigocoleus testarum BC008 TaxID=371196 RepID=A0A0V7ZJS2_9CYAN|nr:DUF4255 domain-containing protein [Mastigocoleus testarum]KST62207.1 hypothetical protein BC008_37825 [Mastigocoleus testarum BC008]KST64837.1 hypothetical protein BC008_18655 [Mastigocoleus testarum BC008]
MFRDLDDSLKRLLEVELFGVLSDSVTVVFDTPDDKFNPPNQRTVDFFLYDVRENRDLRSNERLLERQSNGILRKNLAPVRVDCSYMVTAWSGNTESEHSLLGEVMKVLLRYPTLPDTILVGSLAGQEPSLPTSTLQPARLQSLGEFWQALGGKPKAALHYTVTISVDPFTPVELPLVTEQQILIRSNLQEG